MKSTISDAIKSGGSVDEIGTRTELSDLWEQAVTAMQAARFLAQVADNDSFDEVALRGFGASAELLAKRLAGIANDLELVNSQICAALNERAEVQKHD